MQNFANHRRWNPVHHFFAGPLAYASAVWGVWRFLDAPAADTAMLAVFGLGLAATAFVARRQALIVQNRVIRLEMTLRLSRVLPAAIAARVHELRTRQLVALRFASDAELPDLVQRTLAGEFASGWEIKRAIRDWQPDYLRA